MLHHGIRAGVAILTFTIGIALFWPIRMIQRLETALVDRFYNDLDLKPVSIDADYTAEANEVYRLIIHQKFVRKDRNPIVLRSETIGYSMYVDDARKPEWAFPEAFGKLVKDSMPEVEFETLSNFFLRNRGGDNLKIWDKGVNYVLATESDLFGDSMGPFWANFRKKYPNSGGGYLSFSNVGFNKQYNQAFVNVSWNCGPTCGAGGYILLKKVRGKWEIVKDNGLWLP